MTRTQPAPRIVHIAEGRDRETLADAVRRGLGARPRRLPCQFFYDAAGSELFEQICALPEYYLTRTEDAILAAHAGDMVAGFDRPPHLIELGSGSSTKTRRLLTAALAAHPWVEYTPIDVSEAILEASARALAAEFPGLHVVALAAEYRAALRRLARRVAGPPRLFVFLGSSLGNFEAADAVALLRAVGAAMGPRDRLLLGTDLDKDPARLVAAYDDAAGVTAEFNRNLLRRINAELHADFDPAAFAHRALYIPEFRRIEMSLESLLAQRVRIPGAGLVLDLDAGERIHTENCHKYTVPDLHALARRAGFAEEAAWTGTEGLFRVQRWVRVSGG